MALAGVKVELGQTIGREGRDEESCVAEPFEEFGVVVVGGQHSDDVEKDECRGNSRGDYIGKGIKFFANRGCYFEQTGGKAVEKVEEDASHDADGGLAEGAKSGVVASHNAESEVAEGNKIRDLPFDGGKKFHCVEVFKKRM